MIKDLVAFGCSFIQGQGLTNPEQDNVAACVARQLDLNLENLGMMGASLDDIVWQFKYWLDHCPDPQGHLVLFGLTDSYRQSFLGPNGAIYRPIPAYLSGNDEVLEGFGPGWRDFLDFLFANFDIDQMARQRYWWVTNFISAMCSKLNIKCAMFHVWEPPPGQPSNQDVLDVVSMLNWASCAENRHLLLPCGHTNVDANRIYSQMLTNQIQQRKLV